MTMQSRFCKAVAVATGLLVMGTGNAMNFGDMINPTKWMGGNRDRHYDDYRYGGPGYLPPYGVPPYGVGPGYGGGGAPTTVLILPEGGDVTTATPANQAMSGVQTITPGAAPAGRGYGVAPGYGVGPYRAAPGYGYGYGYAPGYGRAPGYGGAPGYGAARGHGGAQVSGTEAEIERLKARIEELEMKR